MSNLEHAATDSSYDYLYYLERSRIRYRRLTQVPLPAGSTWLDIGVLFPVLPIASSILGMHVWAVEDYSYYPSEVHELYEVTAKQYGVQFINRNLATAPAELGRRFDFISLMAVIEHLPHTPRVLLENVHTNLADQGTFFIDVPNAYWTYTMRRFFLGQHLQIPIESLYNSGIPNLQHHREYSIHDLRYVLQRAGFRIERLETFNYSWDPPWRAWLPPLFLLSQLRPWREVLWATCRKR